MATRFAGSRAPIIPDLNRSGNVPTFAPMPIRSGGVGSSAGDAADTVSLAENYGTQRETSPNFQNLGVIAAASKAGERVAADSAKATMYSQGAAAIGAAASARYKSDAIKKQAAAVERQGAMSAIGGVVSGAIGLLALSDERTKDQIEDIEFACAKLRDLRPVTFKYKEGFAVHPDLLHYGFIAQEYQNVMPDATYQSDDNDLLCIDTRELIALLVKANQELESRITCLELKDALVAS